jgi:hypothetical protein
LQGNQEFQNQTRRSAENYASYIVGQDGTNGSTAGQTPVEWAKRRSIAAGIVSNPGSLVNTLQDWVAQFIIFLKGADVWNTDAATTIASMVTSGKFEELSELTYALRAKKVEF